jgi:hypothetical protein
MQKLVIASLLLGILLWPLSSFAQVTFDDVTAGKMVVALEQARIVEKQLTVMAEENAELQGQLDTLKGTIKLMEEQSIIYQNLIAMNKQMSDAKDKACADAVKAASPTWWDNMSKYLAGVGVGAAFAIAAVLIL